MRGLLFTLVIVGIIGGGCSAQITTKEISASLPGGSTVNGVPFRVSKRFEAVLYEKRQDGYKEVFRKPVTLADPTRLFLLNFEGQMLSNGTVNLALNPDNTISEVTLNSASQLDEALTSTGAQLTTVSTAIQARRAAEAAAGDAEAASVTATANLAIAAEAAKQEADLAELQSQNKQNDPSATAEDVLKAAQRARLTKIKANEAARLAGLAPFFPGIVPGAPE